MTRCPLFSMLESKAPLPIRNLGTSERRKNLNRKIARQRAIQEIKDGLEIYLKWKGITDIKKPFHCLNPEHNDRHPSMHYDKKRNNVYCFSCHAKYDTLDLIGMDYNLIGFNDKLKKGCELFNISINESPFLSEHPNKELSPEIYPGEKKQDYTDFYNRAHQHIGETEYAHNRGLDDNTINRFNLGYVKDWRHPKTPKAPTSPRLIIPIDKYHYLARDIRKDIPEDRQGYKKQKVGKSAPIFNLKALDQESFPIFVVEGELDAISLEQLGYTAIGLGSTNKAGALVRYLQYNPPTRALIIALDNDNAGKKTAGELAAELQNIGILAYNANPETLYTNGKDANENLIQDPRGFEKRLLKAEIAAKEIERAEQEKAELNYEQTSTASYIGAFMGAVESSANTPPIESGFSLLDQSLDGGIYEGLYILGAVTSLGKSTFVLQLADQVARAGNDVLFFALEQSRYELMSKSISRMTYEIAIREGGDVHNCKTARGITAGYRWKHYSPEEMNLITQAISEYGQYAHHVHIFEGLRDIGVDDIKREVQQYKRIFKRSPLVIIDYLQILKPNDTRATDKQNTDYSVLELKRLSRDMKTPIIAISSFNRENYKTELATTAFKESGGIEYTSDILIGLQFEGAGRKNFDMKAEKRKSPRNVELEILKNRNGRTGDVIKFEYNPIFNYWKEIQIKEKRMTYEQPL